MLSITIPPRQWWDEDLEEFKTIKKEKTIQLEHSLISLSKWEAKWKKPFLREKAELTREESIDYVRCMTLTQSVDPVIYEAIDKPIMDKILAYIDDKMTATTITRPAGQSGPTKKEVVTSELIYYWMVSLNIPPQFEKWHLNRLLTLIEVISAKNEQAQAGTKAMRKPSRSSMANRSALNAKRRAAARSRG